MNDFRAFEPAPPEASRPGLYVETGERDVDAMVDRLPPAARDKLGRLRELRDDLYSMTFAAYEKQQALRADKLVAEQEVRRLDDADRQGFLTRQSTEGWNEHGQQTIVKTRDVERLEAARARAKRLAERYDAQRQQHDARAERWNNLGNLLSRIDRWLPSLRATVEPHKPDAVSPRRGEGIADAVERVRGTIRTLQVELDAVEAAPIPSRDAKARIRAHVNTLAETATPDLYQLIERGALDIRYPQRPVTLNVAGKVSASGDSVLGQAKGWTVDPIALLAWLDSGKLIAAFEAEIDRAADDGAALDDKARAKRTAELQAAILDAEYSEELLIEQSEQQGLNVLRRVDADPRAVLGLSAALPAPRE